MDSFTSKKLASVLGRK